MERIFRAARQADIDAVEQGYTELLTYEAEHGAWTAWKLGVYPTRATAQHSLDNGSLYLLEEDGQAAASVILNRQQPEEYREISWKFPAGPEQVMVIHTLCVPPSRAGKGLGKEMVRRCMEEARRQGCTVLRLDTGGQNKPAVGLYTGLGFTIAGTTTILLDGQIPHAGHVFLERSLTD